MLAVIEWSKIGQLLWAAPLAGLAVSLTFALVIFGIGRAGDARRDGAGVAAAFFSGLAITAFLAFAATVVYGVEIITTK